MKTMKITNILFATLCATLLFVSCSKDGEDGAVGPQGPQGEQGVAGPAGADGEQGPQGETGTANVIYSDWITRNFETAGAATSNEQLLETFGFGDFSLTEDVLLVYGRNPVNAIVNDVYQLPYILTSQDEYYGFKVSNFNGGSSLRIQVSTLDGGSNLFTFFEDFRYIIIPGGIPASGKSSVVDYSKMTYQEICEHFNIP